MNLARNPKHPYAHAPGLPEGEGPVSLEDFFSSKGPFEIEIGPGRGGFMFERVAAAPDIHLLGLEIRLKWAFHVDERLRKAGLSARARVLGEDAKRALARLRPTGAVRAVFLHFPDPWWKTRHRKRLVMSDVLLDEVARLLEQGGELFVQTDVEERALAYEEHIAGHPCFVAFGDREGSARMTDNPYGARSPREHRAIADGLPVHRLRYRRRSPGTAGRVEP